MRSAAVAAAHSVRFVRAPTCSNASIVQAYQLGIISFAALQENSLPQAACQQTRSIALRRRPAPCRRSCGAACGAACGARGACGAQRRARDGTTRAVAGAKMTASAGAGEQESVCV